MKYIEGVERGWRIRSLWDSNLGIVKYTVYLHRTAGEVEVLWDNGTTTKEVWRCDIERLTI